LQRKRDKVEIENSWQFLVGSMQTLMTNDNCLMTNKDNEHRGNR